MKWNKIDDKAPRPNDRIVAYTPGELNSELDYRLLTGGSLRICSESTHWLLLEPPNNTVEDRQAEHCDKRGSEQCPSNSTICNGCENNTPAT